MPSTWQFIVSAAVGGWFSAFIVKLLINRSIQNLDRISNKLEHLCRKLSVLEAKLEALERMKILVFEHDRKLVELETRHKANGKGHFTTNSS